MKTILLNSVAMMLLLVSCIGQSNNAQQFATIQDATLRTRSNGTVGGKCDGALQYRAQHCGITFIPTLTGSADMQAYKLNNNQEIKNTIFIYRKRKVVNKFVNYDGDDVKLLLTRLVL